MNTSAWLVFAQDTSTECMIGPALLLWSVAGWTTTCFFYCCFPYWFIVKLPRVDNWAMRLAMGRSGRIQRTLPLIFLIVISFVCAQAGPQVDEYDTYDTYDYDPEYDEGESLDFQAYSLSADIFLYLFSFHFICSTLSLPYPWFKLRFIVYDQLYPISLRGPIGPNQSWNSVSKSWWLAGASRDWFHHFHFVFVWTSFDFVLDSRWLQVNRFNG